MRRLIVLIAAAAIALAMMAAPASATVHEIVGQWCSGQDPLFPPGISGGSNADNFAKPLFANGFIESVVPYLDGVLISFDFDHPASKLVPTGGIVQVAPGTYVTGFELDSEAGFYNCKFLSG